MPIARCSASKPGNRVPAGLPTRRAEIEVAPCSAASPRTGSRPAPAHSGGGDQHRAAHRVALVRMVDEPLRSGGRRLREDPAGLGLHQQARTRDRTCRGYGPPGRRTLANSTRRSRWVKAGLFGQSQAQPRPAPRPPAGLPLAERGGAPRRRRIRSTRRAGATSAGAGGAGSAAPSRPASSRPGSPGWRCNQVRLASGVSACRSAWSARTSASRCRSCSSKPAHGAAAQLRAAVHGVLGWWRRDARSARPRRRQRRHLAAQRLDQRDHRAPAVATASASASGSYSSARQGRLDRRHRRRGNHPGARLGAGQGGLEVEHALQAAAVGEHRAHRRRREIGIEQLVGGYVAHRFSFSRPVRARRSGS